MGKIIIFFKGYYLSWKILFFPFCCSERKKMEFDEDPSILESPFFIEADSFRERLSHVGARGKEIFREGAGKAKETVKRYIGDEESYAVLLDLKDSRYWSPITSFSSNVEQWRTKNSYVEFNDQGDQTSQKYLLIVKEGQNLFASIASFHGSAPLNDFDVEPVSIPNNQNVIWFVRDKGRRTFLVGSSPRFSKMLIPNYHSIGVRQQETKRRPVSEMATPVITRRTLPPRPVSEMPSVVPPPLPSRK